MISYQVDDMTCGHCASTITKAVKATDKDAKITIDLAKHLVTVEPAEASAQEVRDAIAEAGYSPLPVEAKAGDVVATGRSCCGSCH
jgi:copper chaperone